MEVINFDFISPLNNHEPPGPDGQGGCPRFNACWHVECTNDCFINVICAHDVCFIFMCPVFF